MAVVYPLMSSWSVSFVSALHDELQLIASPQGACFTPTLRQLAFGNRQQQTDTTRQRQHVIPPDCAFVNQATKTCL